MAQTSERAAIRVAPNTALSTEPLRARAERIQIFRYWARGFPSAVRSDPAPCFQRTPRLPRENSGFGCFRSFSLRVALEV